MSIECIEQYDLVPSPEIVAAVLREGGLNRFGEPNYRVRWGWRCLELRGGEHVDYDDYGGVRRREVRYEWWPRYAPASSRYHLEVWNPPEAYGCPELWESQTKAYVRGETVTQLGPFPARGDYEHVLTLQSPGGEFVQPTAEMMEAFVRLHKRTRHRTPTEIREDLAAETERKKRDRTRKYHDILDSERVAFPWRTWVPVTGQAPRQLFS